MQSEIPVWNYEVLWAPSDLCSTHIEDGMRQVTLILQDEMIIFINDELSNKGHSLEFV